MAHLLKQRLSNTLQYEESTFYYTYLFNYGEL